jgi:hypothetical protein
VLTGDGSTPYRGRRRNEDIHVSGVVVLYSTGFGGRKGGAEAEAALRRGIYISGARLRIPRVAAVWPSFSLSVTRISQPAAALLASSACCGSPPAQLQDRRRELPPAVANRAVRHGPGRLEAAAGSQRCAVRARTKREPRAVANQAGGAPPTTVPQVLLRRSLRPSSSSSFHTSNRSAAGQSDALIQSPNTGIDPQIISR